MITRENHSTENTFLRYQVGEMRRRPMVVPIYEESRPGGPEVLKGTKTISQTVEIFHVFGFGDTLQKAKRMAEYKEDRE